MLGTRSWAHTFGHTACSAEAMSSQAPDLATLLQGIATPACLVLNQCRVGLLLCRVRNWRLDSLDGANALACLGPSTVCGGTFQCPAPTSTLSVVQLDPGCQVKVLADSGSATAPVTISIGVGISATVSPLTFAYIFLLTCSHFCSKAVVPQTFYSSCCKASSWSAVYSLAPVSVLV